MRVVCTEPAVLSCITNWDTRIPPRGCILQLSSFKPLELWFWKLDGITYSASFSDRKCIPCKLYSRMRNCILKCFLSLSLSGCPRAKKSGIRIAQSKEDKEDQEPIRWEQILSKGLHVFYKVKYIFSFLLRHECYCVIVIQEQMATLISVSELQIKDLCWFIQQRIQYSAKDTIFYNLETVLNMCFTLNWKIT